MAVNSKAPIDQLLEDFNRYFLLDEAEKAGLAARFTERKIKRRQFILQEGDVCKHYTYVAQGCFRKFYVDEKGIERNLQFVAENDWVLEIDSFYNEVPSRVYVEAIEPSVVLQIKRPDLIFLYQNTSKSDKYFRVMTENRFAQQENRILEAISSTAEERYLSFIKQYPNLLSRLPSTQIASYLGITPEFLSKIRKDISKK